MLSSGHFPSVMSCSSPGEVELAFHTEEWDLEGPRGRRRKMVGPGKSESSMANAGSEEVLGVMKPKDGDPVGTWGEA